MPLSILGMILFAACLHATWNAIVKGGKDTLLTTLLVILVSASIAALCLPFLTQPQPESWPYILGSVCFQTTYMISLAYTYRIADISQAYPIMRGTAPFIVALMSLYLFKEPITGTAWLGIGFICVGIIGMAFSARSFDKKGIIMAFAIAVLIACYTLIDGIGVRYSQAVLAYTLWEFLLTAIPVIIWLVCFKKTHFISYAKTHLPLGIIGGIGNVTSYGIALWAMTLAPVAIVAALRETSILFAIAIAITCLKERFIPLRLIMAGVIALGVITLKLS